MNSSKNCAGSSKELLTFIDPLNVNNTILNSINVDELEQIESASKTDSRRNVREKKFKCLSLAKKVNDTTRESNSKNCSTSAKRLNECNEVHTKDKRIKVALGGEKNVVSLNNINESGVKLLEDTLDCVNLTTVLLENKELHQKPTKSSQEFDAFENYINSESKNDKQFVQRKLFSNSNENSINLESKTVPLENSAENCGLSSQTGFSQFFQDSQVVKQIDTAFNLGEEISVSEMAQSATTSNEFKVPQSIRRDVDASLQLPENNRLDLFKNEKLTTQYRQEVDNLFEQIEHSICIMGTEEQSENRTISNELLDIIFCDDVEKNDPKSSSIANIDWTENTLMNAVGMNASFGSAIKKALLVNAGKTPMPQVAAVNNNLNASLSERKAEFCSKGPFYGLPLKVKQLIQQYKGIEELYEWQDECLNLPAIGTRKNLIYALPTSGGKTLVAEILVLREIMCYKRNALFVLPFVAIVQEKVWALSPFAVALDFLVEEYASSKGTYPPRKRRRKRSVYIATIEKALNLVNSLIETGRLYELGLVVVDELHLVGEEGRGATLEALLTKLMFVKANVHIVGMSATIGNLKDICTFLNADVYTQNFRPVELTEYVKCGNEMARVNWNHTDETDLLINHRKLHFKYSENCRKLDPDMLGGLVMEVVPKGSCLIFCASKKNCENVAFLLCKIIKSDMKEYRKDEKEVLKQALKDESGDLCNVLKVSLQFGIPYHHSGLTSDERRLIEDGFRSGIICIICCTSTLAAGVNLPAQRVILRSPYIGRDFINLSRYKQMVGRAGRAGLGEAGDSIVIAAPQDLPKVKKLLLSPMNQALSGMHLTEGKGLRHLLLSCISLGIANTRVELQTITAKTLMAVQSEKLDVNIKRITDIVIKNLFKLGALKESDAENVNRASALCDVTVKLDTSMLDTQNSEVNEEVAGTRSALKKKTVVLKNNSKLVVSNLGSAAIKGGLELSRAHLLYDDLYQAQASLVLLNCLHLLYLVTPYDTSEQIKPNMQIYYELFLHLGPNELQTAKIIGIKESIAVKMLAGQAIKNVPERVLNRFYVTLMLYDLWNEMPVFQVSEKYQINRGIVQNLMTTSATFASNVVYFCEELEEFWSFTHLLKGMSQRLSHCCVRELLPLMELPAVKQSRAKQLYNAGYKNLQSIAKANADDLVESIEFMPRRVANQLVAASKMLLLEKVENLREEAEDVLDGVEHPKQFFNQSVLR